MKCPICLTESEKSICNCGYDFNNREVIEKIKTHYKRFEGRDKWKERASLTKRIHDIQVLKYGITKKGAKGGWGQRKTAILLAQNPATINRDLKLAKNNDHNTSMDVTISRQKEIERLRNNVEDVCGFFLEKFETENELQNYIYDNWEKIEFSKEWCLTEGLYNAKEAGEIDILARNCIDPSKWLVIELKKDVAYESTLGQIHRYMGWIKKNLAGDNGQVKGLIISAYPPDEKLKFALSMAVNIEHKFYCLKNGKVEFYPADFVYHYSEINKHPEQILNLIKNFNTKIS